ncbi:XrtA/PEP-CTERM system TPR-repeat protein PrsT [Colwellia piezophila]|uniref:XrtA/PEP-CTERM system TPR-repeat protein PrsT n=1 Tax=Colwellia piezophila TaxID=211668 RepID=UPI00037FC921|nr:XrtA/PEP-CTERM system TPR-repeat protein PrsT [Colwellia piezophila]
MKIGRSRYYSFLASLFFMVCSLTVQATEQTVAKSQANEHYEKSLISFEEQDYRAAMIHLKNTFQNQKEHMAGRILYAKVLLAHENGVAAEVELNYANELGADLDLIRPLKAKALLFQQKFKAALELTIPGESRTELEIELAYLRGQAFIGLKKFVAAGESFDYALKLAPGYNLANLGKAQIFLARKQFKKAEQYTDKALQGYNIPSRARVIRARLYLIAGDSEAALKQLNQAIELNPNYLAARMIKAEVLLSQGNIELAEEDIDYILDRAPKEPQTNYLRVIAASNKGQPEYLEETLSNILATLAALPDNIRQENPQYLYLAGYILYKQNSLVEASGFFNQYLDLVNDYRAIVMLAEIEITRQEFKSAKRLLGKANRHFPKNETILNLLASAFMGLNQYESAQRYFIESLQINPSNPNVVLHLAESFIAQENYSKAIELLLKIEQAFPNYVPALLALNTSFNHIRQFDQAIARSKNLVVIAPDNSYFHFLHGSNLRANKQLTEAESSFNQAVSLSADYVDAKVALTELLVIQGNTNQAKIDLNILLKQYPKNIVIMKSLASLYYLLAEYSDSALWLEKILAENKEDVGALIALEQVYRKTKQLDKIQLKLEEILAKKSIGKLHELLGGIYLTQRKYVQAIKQYENYVDEENNRAYALSILANAQITANDINGAISSLKKSLSWDNEVVATHILLTKLLMASGKVEAAAKQIKIIRSKDKEGAVADLLAGDLFFKQGQYAQALPLYQRALSINPSTASILALYRTYKKLNKLNKAERLLTSQIDSSEQLELKFVIALADVYQLQNKHEKVTNLYHNALKVYSDSPALLNNLANNLIEQGEIEQAIVFAKRAMAIAPNNVTILDTLAWGEINLANYEAALIYLRKALAIDADNNSVKYHLAIVLDKQGRRKAAQQYLIQVVESTYPFKKKAQANQLLDNWLANNSN